MLDHVSDLVYQTLLKEGFTGDRNQMMSAWLATEGTTGTTLPDRWKQFFSLKLIGGDNRMDQLKSWLIIEGFAQDNINEQWKSYWTARNALP